MDSMHLEVVSEAVIRSTKAIISNLGAVDAAIVLGAGVMFYIIRRRVRSTNVRGPWSSNFFFGVVTQLMRAPDPGDIYEKWATQYGSVFSVPGILGRRRIVLADPKSLAHFAARETYGYVGTPQSKRFQVKLIGKGLFYAEGDSHKRYALLALWEGISDKNTTSRQRRALNPAFSNEAIKNLTHIFFDSAYKVGISRQRPSSSIHNTSPTMYITVSRVTTDLLIGRLSLDTIGLAGFSHDFGTLSGKTSNIATAFDSLGSQASYIDTTIFLLSFIIPAVRRIPTARQVMLNDLGESMRRLGETFLAAADETVADKSVIGLLAKSASTEKISHEEVAAQINVLLIAGYETTSISLTWALIELARNPAMQTKLRNELLQSGGDPTWEELTNHGSFLDAFTCEILRMHPALPEISRMAAEDDLVPLSEPIKDARGKLIDSVFVSKGTNVTLPIQCINRSEVFWGPDAKMFNPARWIDESHGVDKHRAQELQGYRHLLTFSDGPRMCLGKVFAVTEFKAVLSVLLRNFTFELPRGPDTAIGRHRNLLPRPKIEGEAGYDVPLKIQHYVGAE
ncbi:Cytochrome P450 [Mycena sanguinolenta]|uniref:Cytochrome P450 n=1 Tax=Mycena sanguinolenta TaxID=230812 RepID=A0A8H6Y2P8_9AGAR|nr:Cytochrome P450 [Mycena sanguinolenta]